MSAARQLPPHLWKPGVSGNPGGRSPLPPELRAIKALTREECARVVAKYWRMPCHAAAELTASETARDLPMGDAAIIRILQEAITKGDFARLSFLLDRAIGKVETVKEDPVDSAVASMSDDELLALADEIRRKRSA